MLGPEQSGEALPRGVVGGEVPDEPLAGQLATSSRVPGSSNRCVAPETTTSRDGHRIRVRACRFRASTDWSAPPTMRSVGAVTHGSRSPVRSGRPPRDTTAAARLPGSAAAHRAAPALVLAPK